MPFQMYISPIFCQIILRHSAKLNQQKLKALMEIPPLKKKKELQAFLGIISYLSKFSPSTASVCESTRQLTLSKMEWALNAAFQKLFDKAESLIKEDACMKFYSETKPLYLETDTSGVRLGAALLPNRSGTSCPRDKAPENNILRPTVLATKSLLSAERRYMNIERDALGILHGLKAFHHYCFAREASIITDHKPLIAIFKKDAVILSQRIQRIPLGIHKYRVRIIHTWTRSVHCRLALQTEPHRKQRCRDTWHAIEY